MKKVAWWTLFVCAGCSSDPSASATTPEDGGADVSNADSGGDAGGERPDAGSPLEDAGADRGACRRSALSA